MFSGINDRNYSIAMAVTPHSRQEGMIVTVAVWP